MSRRVLQYVARAMAAPCLTALLVSGCGSGPSVQATRVHEDARLAERLVETKPGAAARRFLAAGEGIEALSARHPDHPLTVELREGDHVGDMPRALFEARLAVARRVMGPADLLDAAVTVLPPPPRGLGRLARSTSGPRAVDRLRAALEARGAALPPAVEAHGPPPSRPAPPPPTLPAPLTGDLDAHWAAVRGHADADEWLAAAIGRLPSSTRFIRARALHRGRGWQALAAHLLDAGDRGGAERALGFAVERGLLEGLAAPLRSNGWLPVHLVTTLRAAGQIERAQRIAALYAAGLARVFATPDNAIDDLLAKAEALAAAATEMGDPVALGWLSHVLRRDLLDALRRRARSNPADPAVRRAHARLTTLSPAERAEPALAAVRAMAPALAAAAAAGRGDRGAVDAVRDAGDGLSAPDRVVLYLALARLEPDASDAHLGRALAAIAERPDRMARVDALVDADAVSRALDRAPGPHTRAGLAGLLFDAQRPR